MTVVTQSRVELLAPAGDEECIRAAVENGANAVYFGLDTGFNARARAANLSVEQLPAAMQYLHRRGVKGYVTLNTLAFADELPELEDLIRHVTRAGVDAVLVQDIGLARLIRALSPDLPLHASTQFTLTSAENIAVASELGFERVVLARELSIAEIGKIHRDSGMELEAFVHGALCVAYSGQCLTSESLGGRSANRGQCAQACRLPYTLICDGEDVDLGDRQYLLSPQDLAAYELTPELIAAGVRSFKIEGRLKSAEYVANITRHYRKALDQALGGQPATLSPDDVREMELSFSRGFSPGWLKGCDHKMLVPATSSAKRGVFLGEVVAFQNGRIQLRISSPVKRGDGIVFEGNRAADEEQGGRIYGVYRRGRRLEESVSRGLVEIELARGALDFGRLQIGQSVWKTDDPELTARLRRSYKGADPVRRVGLRLHVVAETGQSLMIDAETETGLRALIVSETVLQPAQKHPLTAELLEQQFARLGHTVYQLTSLEAHIRSEPMIPLSQLSKLRRELIDTLDRLTDVPPQRRIAQGNALAELRASDPPPPPTNRPPQLHVCCRTLEQLAAAVGLDIASVTADFQDIREYRQAVSIARSAKKPIVLATPRIQKPDEAGIFRVLLRDEPDAILVRNLAGLRYYSERQVPAIGDFSLNATNDLTVSWLIEQGAVRVTPSYDLNRDQLLTLVQHSCASRLEIVIHQHMPMFHMEHCVFCAVLSPGTNKTNCGRPCDTHLVKLRDRVGHEHRLTADVGCRNTVFNAMPQSAAEVVSDLMNHGVCHFRIELLEETAAELPQVVDLYSRLISRQIAATDVWQRLKAANRVGVTRGTLEDRRNPLAII